MSYRNRRQKQVEEVVDTLEIPAEDFEALEVGDTVDIDDLELEVTSIDTEFVVASDSDGNEYHLVSGVDNEPDETESDDTEEVTAEVLTVPEDVLADLEVGDGLEIDTGETIAVIEVGESGVIAMGEDDTVYMIVPEGQEEAVTEACKTKKKKTQESVTCPECDSENCEEKDGTCTCADCGAEWDVEDDTDSDPELESRHESYRERRGNIEEANPWHGADGRFPKGGKPQATVWSLYGKRKWIKKHPKTGKLFLKGVNANHKKWGSSNAATHRVAGKFAKRPTQQAQQA